jgi:hypothetical protein
MYHGRVQFVLTGVQMDVIVKFNTLQQLGALLGGLVVSEVLQRQDQTWWRFLYAGHALPVCQAVAYLAVVLVVTAQLLRLEVVVQEGLYGLVVRIVGEGELQLPEVVHALALRVAFSTSRH